MLSEGAYTPEAISMWNQEKRGWVLSRLTKHHREMARKIRAITKGKPE